MEKKRESGIEVLKIISMFFIVIAHIVQTLFAKEKFMALNFSERFY